MENQSNGTTRSAPHEMTYAANLQNTDDGRQIADKPALEDYPLTGKVESNNVSSIINDNSPVDAMALTTSSLDTFDNSPIVLQPTSTLGPTSDNTGFVHVPNGSTYWHCDACLALLNICVHCRCDCAPCLIIGATGDGSCCTSGSGDCCNVCDCAGVCCESCSNVDCGTGDCCNGCVLS